MPSEYTIFHITSIIFNLDSIECFLISLVNSTIWFDASSFFKWLDLKIKNDGGYDLIYNQDSLLINWEYINNRIQSELASNLWGKDYLYFMRLNIDKQFQTALDNFDKAKSLLE